MQGSTAPGSQGRSRKFEEKATVEQEAFEVAVKAMEDVDAATKAIEAELGDLRTETAKLAKRVAAESNCPKSCGQSSLRKWGRCC